MFDRMHDPEIRAALDARLQLRFAGQADTLIRHELGVCQGARRVDVAVINGHLDGWEIKSDFDSLSRLPGQAELYSKVLDRAWLVTTDRHLVKAWHLVPSWWGVMHAVSRERGVTLTQLRRPRLSPVLDPMSIAQLLWRAEALDVLQARGLAAGLSRSARWYVWARLVETTPLAELRALVRQTLRARREWPGGPQPS